MWLIMRIVHCLMLQWIKPCMSVYVTDNENCSLSDVTVNKALHVCLSQWRLHQCWPNVGTTVPTLGQCWPTYIAVWDVTDHENCSLPDVTVNKALNVSLWLIMRIARMCWMCLCKYHEILLTICQFYAEVNKGEIKWNTVLFCIPASVLQT